MGSGQCYAQSTEGGSELEVNELEEKLEYYILDNLDSVQFYLRLLGKKSPPESKSRSTFLRMSLTYQFFRNNVDSSIYYSELYYQYGKAT